MSSPDGHGGWGAGNWGAGGADSGGWGSNPYGSEPGPAGQPPNTSYQGFGLFEPGRQSEWGPQGPYGKPPRRGRGTVIALVSLAVVLLLAGVTTVVVLNWPRSTSQATPPPASTPTTPVTSEPSTTESSTTVSSTTESSTDDTGSPSDKQTFVAPVIPGWRGIAWPNFNFAYDIPPSWQPKPGTDLGVGDDTTSKHVIVTAASLYMENYCGASNSSYRAITGLASSTDTDPATAATHLIDNWASYGFTSHSGAAPKVSKDTPREVTLPGDRKAMLATATITPPAGVPCSASQEAISVVALSGSNSSLMLMALGDQGFPGAVSPADLQRIVTSLRHTG